MDMFVKLVNSANTFLWNVVLILLLCGTGIYYTFRLKFVQIREFKQGLKQVFGGIGKKHEKKEGEMTSFQSVATAIAAQVGTGNLTGAATALIGGGPGAIFWMWMSAFFGMATIYAEATLAQNYKTVKHGEVTGGPVYYIHAAFKGLFGKILGVIFAIFLILALGFMGNMVQSNSISTAFSQVFTSRNISIPPFTVGLLLAVVSLFVFIGGTNRLAAVVEKLVPFMALVYIAGSLIVILCNITRLPSAVAQIFLGAFNPSAVLGGAAGVTVKEAIRYGVARGLFSNEAGVGSAPNAAASAGVSHPVKQGLVQMLSVYIDTIVICSATAFMLLCSGIEPSTDLQGMPYVQAAVANTLGSFGTIFITIALVLFAFTTLIGNFYYAEMGLGYICDKTPNKALLMVFRLAAALIVCFGATMEFSVAWNTADVLMGLMAIINLPVILILGGPAVRCMNDYLKQKKEGKNPVFKAKDIDLETKTDFWN